MREYSPGTCARKSSKRRRHALRIVIPAVGMAALSGVFGQAEAGSTPPPANSLTFGSLTLPAGAPAFLAGLVDSALIAPLPFQIGTLNFPAVIPQNEADADPTGTMGTFQPNGPTTTATNPFFQSLGTNGRSCGTCHQPATSMSVSAASVAARFALNGPTDPIFAPVDGANCPSLVAPGSTSGALIGGVLGGTTNAQSFAASHSLVLGRGVFRIALPVPAGAEFTVSVVSDPYGCETDPTYSQINGQQIVSMYRRPLMSANLPFVIAPELSFGGPPVSPIMWDGREPSLESQAVNATLGHAQAIPPGPTPAQVQQIVAFETAIFTAQSADKNAGPLNALGATGGPQNLAAVPPGQPGFFLGVPSLGMYSAWQTITGTKNPAAAQASVFRGQQIFNNRPFTVTAVGGFNDLLPGGGPAPGTNCQTCHNQVGAASDLISPPQRDLGVAGDSPNLGGPSPSAVLPILKLTCPAGTTAYNGTTNGSTTVVLTNDPGRAMITGKCADISKFTAPPLRGLAARAPYFHDGSAATLADVVNFYSKRFQFDTPLSNTDKADLVNFLNTL